MSSNNAPSPCRIASLLAGATEILCGLGVAEKIVGISHECDWPADVLDRPRLTQSRIDDSQSSDAIDAQVKSMTRDGAALYEVDAATLRSLRPDVIVTQAQCDVCAVSYDDVLRIVGESDELSESRIVAMNPMCLDDVLRDITVIGSAIEAADAANRYVERLQRRLAQVAERTAKAGGERPRVICIEWIEPLMVSANWMPDLIHAAGGRCDITESGRHSSYTDWSDVVKYDPEVIVVSPCGFDLARTLSEAKALRRLPGWSDLRAVKNHRVFAVDGNAYFNRSGPRLVDSVELLAKAIYGQPTDMEPPGAIANFK